MLVRGANRFSMPVFPASFSPPVLVPCGRSGPSPCRPMAPVPRCGVAVTMEAARRSHSERRPYSVVVTTASTDLGGGVRRVDEQEMRPPRSRSVGALACRSQPSPPLPPSAPRVHLSLNKLISRLQAALSELYTRQPSVQRLMDQLTAIVQLLKKNAEIHSHHSSSESILIETALEAFSFLDDEDYVNDESCELDASPSIPPSIEPSFRDGSGGTVIGDLTLKTTDSGIGSIAQRPSRPRHVADSHIWLGDSSVGGCTTAGADVDDENEPVSADESTGVDDVDVALTWHLVRCLTLVQNVNPSTENLAVMELEKHARIIEQLLEIATVRDLNFDEILDRVLVDSESAQFWRHCAAGEHVLFCSSDSFLTHFQLRLPAKLNRREIRLMCNEALPHLHMSDSDRTDQHYIELLSQTVTLHWLAQTFQYRRVSGIDEYVRSLQPADSGAAGTTKD